MTLLTNLDKELVSTVQSFVVVRHQLLIDQEFGNYLLEQMQRTLFGGRCGQQWDCQFHKDQL